MTPAVLSTAPKNRNVELDSCSYSKSDLQEWVIKDERIPEDEGDIAKLLYNVLRTEQERSHRAEQERSPLWIRFTPSARHDTEREDLKQEVNELLESAGEENWDGEGALAITLSTVAIAQRLIDEFPGYVGNPDVAATPHGEIDFDWVIGQDTMLTVSVGPSNQIAFAGIFHTTRLHGSEDWGGTLPHFVNCCFERIRECNI